MERKKTLVDKISIFFTATSLAHFLLAFLITPDKWFYSFAFTTLNLGLIFATLLFSLTILILLSKILKNYRLGIKNLVKVQISKNFKIALFLWAFEVLIEIIIFISSLTNHMGEMNSLIELGKMNNEVLYAVYITEIVSISLMLVTTITSTVLLLLASKALAFVSQNGDLVTGVWTLAYNVSLLIKDLFKKRTKEIKDIEEKKSFKNDNFVVDKYSDVELKITTIENQKLKEAKKGLTPPDYLF
ncbi:hypothetical protein ESOMN_v1c01680 [Williamsoniiplasma somnilux]|uniref:Uncharacterized protein n=1 Tax=Williamsoniiplasma somnilux TaxID=215578 RepID=A0A2K8P0X8_9MOLU|nr:hypothetical protein [Williamsoniiplasma somnilux]ATZ18553.1 hypothetical protein ESOMN_v1c01680 [Williamsoniiplasma somnilux]